MIKHLRILLALTLLMAVSAAKASTLYYVVDNIRYAVNTDDRTAMVATYGAYKVMTEITIPASITVEGVAYRVTSLEDNCFDGCTSLASITIPNSVTSLGDHCFYDCTSLKSVTIPNSVTELGKFCFTYCSSVATVKLPESVTDISGAFYRCTGLKSITIPASVKKLYYYKNLDTENYYGCFEGCTSLRSITIPNSVTEIRYHCFYGCTSLKEVTCLAETPPRTDWSFEDEAEKTLYVPAASVEAYKTSYDWKDFGKILPLSASGIKAVSKDDIGMSVENGTLTLSNVPENEPVSVYSTTGQLLGTGKGNISIDAQGAQMVIVKVGGKSYKMLVK